MINKRQRSEGSQLLKHRAPKDVQAGDFLTFFGVPVVAVQNAIKGKWATFHKRCTVDIFTRVMLSHGFEGERGPLFGTFAAIPGTTDWQSLVGFTTGDDEDAMLIGLVETIREDATSRFYNSVSISLCDGMAQAAGDPAVDARLTAVEEKNDDQDVAIGQNATAIDDLGDRVTTVEGLIGDQEVDLAQFQAALDDLQTQADELASENDTQDDRLDIIQITDIPAIQATLANLSDSNNDRLANSQVATFQVVTSNPPGTPTAEGVTVPISGSVVLQLKNIHVNADLRDGSARCIDDGSVAFDTDETSTRFAMPVGGAVYSIRIQLKSTPQTGEAVGEQGSSILISLDRVDGAGNPANPFSGQLDHAAGHWTAQGLTTLVENSEGFGYQLTLTNNSDTEELVILDGSHVLIAYIGTQ